MKPTSDKNKINESKLRDYENMFELVLSGNIRLDNSEANDFLHNLDGHAINLLNENNEVLKIDIDMMKLKLI